MEVKKMTSTCGTCAYWNRERRQVVGTGECTRILERHWGEIAGAEIVFGREAMKVTEPGYYAQIITGAEFGCVLHITRA